MRFTTQDGESRNILSLTPRRPRFIEIETLCALHIVLSSAQCDMNCKRSAAYCNLFEICILDVEFGKDQKNRGQVQQQELDPTGKYYHEERESRSSVSLAWDHGIRRTGKENNGVPANEYHGQHKTRPWARAI